MDSTALAFSFDSGACSPFPHTMVNPSFAFSLENRARAHKLRVRVRVRVTYPPLLKRAGCPKPNKHIRCCCSILVVPGPPCVKE